MIVFSCSNVSKSYGADIILKDISFNIHSRDRIGVVGPNGAGKTTLLKIMADIEGIDKGVLNMPGTTSIGYLSQHPAFDDNQKVWDYILDNFSHLIEMEKQMRILEKNMAASKDDMLKKFMKQYGELSENFHEAGGYEYKSLVRGALKGLGIDEDQFNSPLKLLSGGQQTRVSLAGLLLKKYQLLLLDEPTNYLDINAIEWLESFLADYDGAIVLVSHDRYFLDRICTRIFEVRDTGLLEFSGNYSSYAFQKEKLIEIGLKHYKNQASEIKRQQQIINRLKSFNREKSVRRAKSREKQLASITRLKKPPVPAEKVQITLEPAVKSGRDVLSLEDIEMIFPGRHLFSAVNLKVYRGDIIGIIGPNGAGKTTLLNIIESKLAPTDGSIIMGHNVHTAYYHQQQENIDQDKSIVDEVHDKNPDLNLNKIRNILAAFLFREDDIYKQIKDLSGGEKSRVAIINMMLSNANLLLLDEPTNHLDIQSREVLEDALIDYSGTVLVISHDRYFLDRVTTKTAELTATGTNLYYGNYSYYKTKKQQEEENLQQYDQEGITKTAVKQQKRREREQREYQKQKKEKLQTVEQQIMHAEEKIQQLHLSMSSPEVYTNAEKSKDIHKQILYLENKLNKLYNQWENMI